MKIYTLAEYYCGGIIIILFFKKIKISWGRECFGKQKPSEEMLQNRFLSEGHILGLLNLVLESAPESSQGVSESVKWGLGQTFMASIST